MKKVVCLVLLAGVLLFVYGCRKDVFVDPPPSLTGEYQGIYIYKFEGQTESSQPIIWRFTSLSYTMWYDEESGTGQTFCDNRGQYVMDGSTVTMETTDPNLNADVCATGANPAGAFAVYHPTIEDDTLKLIQVVDDLTVTIKLVPDIGDDEEL